MEKTDWKIIGNKNGKPYIWRQLCASGNLLDPRKPDIWDGVVIFRGEVKCLAGEGDFEAVLLLVAAGQRSLVDVVLDGGA